MEVLRSTVDPASDKFKGNEAAMRALVDDLAARHAPRGAQAAPRVRRSGTSSGARCCRANG